MNIRSHLYDSETWQSEILEDASLEYVPYTCWSSSLYLHCKAVFRVILIPELSNVD